MVITTNARYDVQIQVGITLPGTTVTPKYKDHLYINNEYKLSLYLGTEWYVILAA